MKKRIFGLAAATAFAIAAIAAPAAAFDPLNDGGHSPHGDCEHPTTTVESFTGVKGMQEAHDLHGQAAAWSAVFNSAQIEFCDE